MNNPQSILLACLSLDPADGVVQRLRDLSVDDWPAIRHEAVRHGVVPNLYAALNPHVQDLVLPGEWWDAMQMSYFGAASRNLRLFHQLERLLSVFTREDIPVVLLKGAFLAETFYGDVALRAMGDIDLLVKEADLERVDRMMRGEGTTPLDRCQVVGEQNKHFIYKLAGTGLRVEIHWTLSTGGEVRRDVADLWRRVQPVPWAPGSAATLCPEDLLLHLCLHTAGHIRDLRLLMLLDLVEVARHYGERIDWTLLGARARAWGVSRAVYVMMRLAVDWLGAPVPREALEGLRPEGLDESVVDAVALHFLEPSSTRRSPMSVGAARLWHTKGFRARMRHLKGAIVASPEQMASMYGAPVRSWRRVFFYPLRVMDVARRHRNSLWRLIRGGRTMRSQAARVASQADDSETLRRWLVSG